MRERVLLILAVAVAVVGGVLVVVDSDTEPRLAQETNGARTPRTLGTATTTPDPGAAGVEGATTTTVVAPVAAVVPSAVEPSESIAPAIDVVEPSPPGPPAPPVEEAATPTGPPPTAPPAGTADRAGVFAVDPATGAARVLVDGAFAVQAVAPRGDRMLVSPGSFRAGPDAEWFILDLDGRRTTIPVRRPSISFSPDGRRIAYVGDAGIEVWDSDRPSEPPRTALALDYVSTVHWSPTDDLLTFTGDSGTEVVRADGTGRRVVSQDPYGQFSPDGSRLLFNHSGINTTILVVRDLQGAVVADLSRDLEPGQATSGALWSPDGRSIGYVLEQEGAPWRPCVVTVASGAHACGEGHVRFFLGWTPNGELLVPTHAGNDDGYTTALRVVGPGTGVDRVLLPARDRLYHLLPDGERLLASGEVLVSVLGPPM